MATPRRICPHTLKFTESMLDLAPSANANATPAPPRVEGVPCIGPQCQYWHFEAGENPNDGNCVDVISGIGMKLVAQLLLNTIGRQQQEQAEATDPSAPQA